MPRFISIDRGNNNIMFRALGQTQGLKVIMTAGLQFFEFPDHQDELLLVIDRIGVVGS